MAVKKLKQEAALAKLAIQVGEKYALNRGYTQFNPTDSADQKAECIYRLLVTDKLVTPLAKDQESVKNMKHKLAIWLSRQLPEDHPLLK